jgi:hypothetical protein
LPSGRRRQVILAQAASGRASGAARGGRYRHAGTPCRCRARPERARPCRAGDAWPHQGGACRRSRLCSQPRPVMSPPTPTTGPARPSGTARFTELCRAIQKVRSLRDLLASPQLGWRRCQSICLLLRWRLLFALHAPYLGYEQGEHGEDRDQRADGPGTGCASAREQYQAGVVRLGARPGRTRTPRAVAALPCTVST